jgi:hypothetical protein
MSVGTGYARKACAQEGRGLVPGVEDEGVVEEREGGAVEGAGDEEGPHEALSAFHSMMYLMTRTEY